MVQTGGQFYPEHIVDAWSRPQRAEWTQRYKENIRLQNEHEIYLVAELDSQPVGFTHVPPSENEYRALYVHPDFGRQGVASRLFEEAEGRARQQADWLELAASRVAESFYRKHGYEVTERGTFDLGELEMECAYMRKEL